MATQAPRKLNWLEKNLPEGLIVDAAWLGKQGYSTALRSQYVANKWLEQPTRGVYRRTRGKLAWQQVVISLQTLLNQPQTVGGRTALELQGFTHYLSKATREVHLYGPTRPPGWLAKLPLDVRFVTHNDLRLFRDPAVARGLTSLNWNIETGSGRSDDPIHGSFTVLPWGQWDWPLTLSTPERAILELLDELPKNESFYQVDKLMESLTNLSPRRLQKLLLGCRSIKVKRLFFFFADRHKHAWLKRISKEGVDLGSGKRMLAKPGKLDPTYQITVPEDLDGLR